jgi:hypothetical protein
MSSRGFAKKLIITSFTLRCDGSVKVRKAEKKSTELTVELQCNTLDRIRFTLNSISVSPYYISAIISSLN